MPAIRLFLMWTCARSLVYIFFRVLYRLRLHDRENVPLHGPIIYVSNHQSHFDPPLVGLLVTDRPCAFMARSTLFENRLFGALIRLLNAIPLDRSRGGAGAMRAAETELEAGRGVLLFPEGTRTRDGALGVFRPGFLLLVRRTRAQVVPVAVEGAWDAWPIGQSRPKLRGWISVKAAEAIQADELLAMPPEEATERVKRTIETMRLELRDEVRRRSGGRWPSKNAGELAYWERDATGDGG
jgi:1-acyl-sn-glycerol-3-phosphate acyltransferase